MRFAAISDGSDQVSILRSAMREVSVAELDLGRLAALLQRHFLVAGDGDG